MKKQNELKVMVAIPLDQLPEEHQSLLNPSEPLPENAQYFPIFERKTNLWTYWSFALFLLGCFLMFLKSFVMWEPSETYDPRWPYLLIAVCFLLGSAWIFKATLRRHQVLRRVQSNQLRCGIILLPNYFIYIHQNGKADWVPLTCTLWVQQKYRRSKSSGGYYALNLCFSIAEDKSDWISTIGGAQRQKDSDLKHALFAWIGPDKTSSE